MLDDVNSPSYLVVNLKASKTDPFRLGVSVFLGRTNNTLCPIAAVLVLRGQEDGAFFRFSDGRLLTRARFVSAVRVALEEGGVDARNYSGHSFRIGAATTCQLNEGFQIISLRPWAVGKVQHTSCTFAPSQSYIVCSGWSFRPDHPICDLCVVFLSVSCGYVHTMFLWIHAYYVLCVYMHTMSLWIHAYYVSVYTCILCLHHSPP